MQDANPPGEEATRAVFNRFRAELVSMSVFVATLLRTWPTPP
jgi:hypothetical protein